MDKLCGLGSLQVVYHRFSDGVQVVRCVLDFFKAVSDLEQSYSMSISRLVRSSAYTFHSNILMQWLGSEPYEEIGTVKHCWQQLGTELSLLADHHAHKAEGYLTSVRIQLQALLPRLEEMRLKLKNKIQKLKTSVEVAEKIHSKEKQKYVQIGETCLKLRTRLDEGEGQPSLLSLGTANMKRTEHKEAVLTRDLEFQETVYKSAHEDLVKTYHNFNKDIQELYREVEQTERERVKTLKESLQQFTKTISNTAPAYLESMGKIVISVDEIDASSDINSFVESQSDLTEELSPPPFEKHAASMTLQRQEVPPSSTQDRKVQSETDSMLNGNRTPSLQSQKSMSDDSSYESDTEEVKGQGTKVSQPQNKPECTSEEVVSKPLKPSIKPKPADRKDLSSISDRSHVTSSSSHLSRSSEHSSSSTHVTSVVEQIETAQQKPGTKRESQDRRSRSALPKARVPPKASNRTNTRPTTVNIRVPPVSSLDQTAESARPRTNTLPSPTVAPSSPGSARRRAQSGHTTKEGDQEPVEILIQLKRLSATNNYYGLLGVESGASLDELTRARRERSRLLHPDHFAGQPEKKLKAEEQLSQINQIFQDVLKNEDTRSLYDKLCHFRHFYERIPEQSKGLEKAQSKLEAQYKLMKKAQFPLPLLEEVQLAIKLVQVRISKLPSES